MNVQYSRVIHTQADRIDSLSSVVAVAESRSTASEDVATLFEGDSFYKKYYPHFFANKK